MRTRETASNRRPWGYHDTTAQRRLWKLRINRSTQPVQKYRPEFIESYAVPPLSTVSHGLRCYDAGRCRPSPRLSKSHQDDPRGASDVQARHQRHRSPTRGWRRAVFGSVAGGDAGPDSDVNFLVEVESGRSILAVGGFLDEVSELIGSPVHVVTAAAFRP